MGITEVGLVTDSGLAEFEWGLSDTIRLSLDKYKNELPQFKDKAVVESNLEKAREDLKKLDVKDLTAISILENEIKQYEKDLLVNDQVFMIVDGKVKDIAVKDIKDIKTF